MMIQRNQTSDEKVQFTFYAPQAKSVAVAGSFNGWDPTHAPLRKDRNGDWSAALTLAPGRHEYCFVADGQWFTDPNAPETAPNPYGGQNSVRVVAAADVGNRSKRRGSLWEGARSEGATAMSNRKQ